MQDTNIGKENFGVVYVDTVGKNTKKIKEYTANQLKEDQLSQQLTIKDFDPFKG